MAEKRRGLPIRFRKEDMSDIPGTEKVRIVLPALEKRDSKNLFGIDKNYVERDKLPSCIELEKKYVRVDKKNPNMRYSYLDPNESYQIRWYGQGWDTPEPIKVTADVIQQAFGMGRSHSREELKKYRTRNMPRNPHGEMLYENDDIKRYNEKPERQKRNDAVNRQSQKYSHNRRIPIIFLESQIVNKSEYSHKKTKEELQRLEKIPPEKRNMFEKERINGLKNMLKTPLMMYKIILPDSAHRKALEFKKDSSGIDRNSRIAYIDVPMNICHVDKKQQINREKLIREAEQLKNIPEEKRLKAQNRRLELIDAELKKPAKMYFYMPEYAEKGVRIHFEGIKTGISQDGKALYDKPEDYVLHDAHELRAAFGMGHYYTKEERIQMEKAKEKQKTLDTAGQSRKTDRQGRTLFERITDAFRGSRDAREDDRNER